MKRFPSGHATHPQWRMAVALVLAQLRAQMALPEYASAPTLGAALHHRPLRADARDILDALAAELPEVTDWAGTVGVGMAANNAEYFDEPALAVMLCDLPPTSTACSPAWRRCRHRPGHSLRPHTALVHADAGTPDVAELIAEMAAAHHHRLPVRRPGLQPRRGGAVCGGRQRQPSRAMARPAACSAAACRAWPLARAWHLVSRVTQGCQPVAPVRTITAADGNVLLQLDGEPALDVLLRDLAITAGPAPGGHAGRGARHAGRA
jgi:small ligand-binding sensory domain FIST